MLDEADRMLDDGFEPAIRQVPIISMYICVRMSVCGVDCFSEYVDAVVCVFTGAIKSCFSTLLTSLPSPSRRLILLFNLIPFVALFLSFLLSPDIFQVS